MVRVSEHIQLDEQELEFMAIRAQGAGGQNVNKVSSAIHLRFDIRASSLPEHCKERLLQYRDHRISKDGVIVIKAQRHRTQEQNREDAIARLVELIQAATVVEKVRRPTRPTRSFQRKRVDNKTQRGTIKALRGKVEF